MGSAFLKAMDRIRFAEREEKMSGALEKIGQIVAESVAAQFDERANLLRIDERTEDPSLGNRISEMGRQVGELAAKIVKIEDENLRRDLLDELGSNVKVIRERNRIAEINEAWRSAEEFALAAAGTAIRMGIAAAGLI